MNKNIASLLILSVLTVLLLKINNSDARNRSEYLYILAPKGLNMRKEDDLKSSILTLIPYKQKVLINYINNKTVVIDDIEGKWTNVTYDNKTGWVFDGYTSRIKPLESTSEGIKILKSIINNFNNDKIKLHNNYFEYGLSPEEIIRRFGKPESLGNISGEGTFNYEYFWICFDDFFEGMQPTLNNYKITAYKHDYKTEGLYYFPKNKFNYDDVINIGYDIGEFYFNGHDKAWECRVKSKVNRIYIQFENINGYIRLIRVHKLN